jgi:hypothetical protein
MKNGLLSAYKVRLIAHEDGFLPVGRLKKPSDGSLNPKSFYVPPVRQFFSVGRVIF